MDTGMSRPERGIGDVLLILLLVVLIELNICCKSDFLFSFFFSGLSLSSAAAAAHPSSPVWRFLARPNDVDSVKWKLKAEIY